MVVVEYAKSNRSTCHTCNQLIEKDTLRIGTTVSNDGYINIEWHHDPCFWETRCRKYFYRKNKKINTVLKIDQFSGLSELKDKKKMMKYFDEKIREANLRFATPAALTKHGITASDGENEVGDADAVDHQHDGDEEKQEQAVEEVVESKVAAEIETKAATKGKGRKRKATA